MARWPFVALMLLAVAMLVHVWGHPRPREAVTQGDPVLLVVPLDETSELLIRAQQVEVVRLVRSQVRRQSLVLPLNVLMNLENPDGSLPVLCVVSGGD